MTFVELSMYGRSYYMYTAFHCALRCANPCVGADIINERVINGLRRHFV